MPLARLARRAGRLEVELLENRVVPAAPTVFAGAGATAATQFAAYKAAIGGVDNGATATPQNGGFRTINWDAVGLGATDGVFTNQVITPNHTVGIPLNRFQARGTFFEEIYAVTDTSFTTENPGLQPPVQFPPFSDGKIFAMFNDNTIGFSFVLPSAPSSAKVQAATRGFGAIFLDVEHANSSSIEYFHGDISLGKFFVPPGNSTEPEFLGVLFDNPVVTKVEMTVGDGLLFSFNGSTVTPGFPDLSISGITDTAAVDDFAFPEPVALHPTLAAGTGPGGGLVRTFDAASGAVLKSFTPYVGFLGEIRVAQGDVNDDGIPDIITGAGPGPAGGHVKAFNGLTGAELQSFFAFPGFAGGVNVATGDVNDDGFGDLVVGAGPGAGPHVKVFSGKDGSLLDSFFAYAPGFRGGVSVAAGDINGDGRADIITGAGPGAGPHVIAYSGIDLSILRSFFAYAAGFTGGVTVAAGDVDGDGKADILTGAGPGAGPHVEVFSGANNTLLDSFFGFAAGFAGGVRVSAADLNGDGKADIIVGAGPGAGPHLRAFNAVNLADLDSFFAFDAMFHGGIFVGGSGG